MTPRPDPRISIVTVTFNAARFVKPFCEAVASFRSAGLETIVVVNASRDETARIVGEALPAATVIPSPRNLGFAGGSNLGAARAAGDVLLFLNPDTRPAADAAERLCLPVWQRESIGAAGCKLVFPDGRLQCAGGVIGPNGIARQRGWAEPDHGQYDREEAVDYVPGAALAIRRDLFCELGGFHDGYFPGFYEDTELCLRLRRRGYDVLYLPAPRIVHLESQSMGRRHLYWLHRNRLLFLARNARGPIGPAAAREAVWLYREHLRPVCAALAKGQPRRLRLEWRRLTSVAAGELAGVPLALGVRWRLGRSREAEDTAAAAGTRSSVRHAES